MNPRRLLLLPPLLALGVLTACGPAAPEGAPDKAPSPSASTSSKGTASLAAAWDVLGGPAAKAPTPWRVEALRLKEAKAMTPLKGKEEAVTITFSKEKQALLFTGLPNLKMLRVKTLTALAGEEGGVTRYRLEVEEPDAMTMMASTSEKVNALETTLATKVPQEPVVLTLSADGQGLTMKTYEEPFLQLDRTP